MSNIFYFKQYESSSEGGKVNCLDIPDSCESEDIEDYDLRIELSLPTKKKYKSLIIDHDDESKVILEKEFNTKKHAKNFLLQTYCKFNDCTPFIVTYNDKGFYGPKIPITSRRIRKYDKSFNYHMFGVILSKSSCIIDTLSIQPRE